jgi:hypothetical protein
LQIQDRTMMIRIKRLRRRLRIRNSSKSRSVP